MSRRHDRPPPRWDAAAICREGDPVEVFGIDPWAVPWRAIDTWSIRVAHPAYPAQLHTAALFEVEIAEGAKRFAAAELSPGVWGSYVESSSDSSSGR